MSRACTRSLSIAGRSRRAAAALAADEPSDDADPALRRADAGEPLVRQLLRHLSRRGRDPERHLHARRRHAPGRASGRSGSAIALSPISVTTVASTGSSATAGDGRLRPGGLRSIGRRRTARSMGYYDDRDLPFYWNVADEYVLFDRFFAATTAGSVANHMFWVTGTPGDPDGEASARGFGQPTIFDRLEPARDLVEVLRRELRPGVTSAPGAGDRVQAVRVPLLNYGSLRRRPEAASPTSSILTSTTRTCATDSCPRSRTSRPPDRASIRPAASRPARRSCAR